MGSSNEMQAEGQTCCTVMSCLTERSRSAMKVYTDVQGIRVSEAPLQQSEAKEVKPYDPAKEMIEVFGPLLDLDTMSGGQGNLD